ncbi:MAG: polysaccharide biosynthesis/export family protein [Steroidobacteraceae bacterium]
MSAQTSATLAAGDVLKITVFGNPDLTTETRIQPNGTITFPLIGTVSVGGTSPAAAEERIATRLRSGGYVKNAAVTVFVQERSSVRTSAVTLLGQVVHPGIYTPDPESPDYVGSVVALLAKAGGVTDKAADRCFLLRVRNGQPTKLTIDLVDLIHNGNINADLTLNNGDVVLVPGQDVFYIYGEVQHPGMYRLERDMTVMQALAVGSGMTPRGNIKGILLNRQVNGSIKSLSASLDDKLQSNDVVYVKTAVF